ncbi:helix-turn-helix transcriptional regulator [Pseudomonas sp. YL2]|jgi:predicted DNA-binding transcriptional regulator AlpA|uniref:helix-turn-helix transcriptional regulator n=1 Tax=Pseudomonas sp. YL2 TaxID=2904251 RepID=UPI001FF5F925|nr:AlpA family phage regulatory protein [Pseudomonas sp. YL2]
MKIDTHRSSGQATAAAIGITESTLIRWAKDPEFPQPLRITRKVVRYDLDAVKRYLSERAA